PRTRDGLPGALHTLRRQLRVPALDTPPDVDRELQAPPLLVQDLGEELLKARSPGLGLRRCRRRPAGWNRRLQRLDGPVVDAVGHRPTLLRSAAPRSRSEPGALPRSH